MTNMIVVFESVSALIPAVLLIGAHASASTVTLRHLGGPLSLKYEIDGRKSEMTDTVLDHLCLKACPAGYQSNSGDGYVGPDGAEWWQFTFFCMDPGARLPQNSKERGHGLANLHNPSLSGTAAVFDSSTIALKEAGRPSKQHRFTPDFASARVIHDTHVRASRSNEAPA